MGIAWGMKELAQGIVSSHEERTKRIEEIRKETQQTRQEAKDLVSDLQASRKEMVTQLRKDLAQDKAERKTEVSGLIKDFQSSRREMSSELKKQLCQGVENRKSEVKQMLTDAQGLIKDFQSARNEMSSELKKQLHRGVESRKSEVKQMLGDFGKAQAEVRADLKEAHDAWQELISKKKAVVKVLPKVKKVEEERVEAPAVEKEVPDWEKKLLTAIRENPNGITLAEVAESLGVAPVVLGRASKSLLERGEIRKEEKLYFPVTEEES